MKVKARMQMGVERRETEFELPDEQVVGYANNFELVAAVEELVMDWICNQIRWGWSGKDIEVDFSHMEGATESTFVTVQESAIPNTNAVRRE